VSQNAMSLCPTCETEVFEVTTQAGQRLLMDRSPLARGHYRLATRGDGQVVAIPVPSLYKAHTCAEAKR